jgi:anti-anti-sigma regulatory factor
MWKLQRVPNGKLVVLKLSGRIEAEELSELKTALATEASAENLVLDLSEVDLAGQEAVKFLASYEARGTRLRNCPAYIRDWITRERNGAHS